MQRVEPVHDAGATDMYAHNTSFPLQNAAEAVPSSCQTTSVLLNAVTATPHPCPKVWKLQYTLSKLYTDYIIQAFTLDLDTGHQPVLRC